MHTCYYNHDPAEDYVFNITVAWGVESICNHTSGISVSIICVTEMTNLNSVKTTIPFLLFLQVYVQHATCNCMHGDRIAQLS